MGAGGHDPDTAIDIGGPEVAVEACLQLQLLFGLGFIKAGE